MQKRLNRREALGVLGAVGAYALVGCKGDDETVAGPNPTCVLTPLLTEGPYFVDERLNRSNITGGQPGLPLGITVNVYNANSSTCAPLAGVQIDIWHASPLGVYSDVPGPAAGLTFLRGYQVTDSAGNVAFTTVYPGWYRGRATHIHLKARTFNASGNTTLEATTQLFFDDAITDVVYVSNAPYTSRPQRDTRNSQDSIYGGHTQLLLALNGSPNSGYIGSITIGIPA